MLLSMTGFGNATGQNDRIGVSLEVKAVNNRYLKISTRLPEVLGPLEPDFERTVRKSVARGTVSVNVRLTPVGQSTRYRINTEVLEAYWHQLEGHVVPVPATAESMLSLPGVVDDALSGTIDCRQEWSLLEQTLTEALENLQGFRRREGEAMREDLAANCAILGECLAKVSERAPLVVSEYRDKILGRVEELLKDHSATVTADDLIREVSVFADRCDINEEITRLRCHIEEFAKVMDASASQGRKLDFLSQEMFREVNTIGSKANDVEIAHSVVDMKAAVEKMREILQNVE